MSGIVTLPGQSRTAAVAGVSPGVHPWLTGGTLLAAIVLLTILEGAGRKWLFPQYPLMRYAAYFSKDVLFVIAAYCGLRERRRFELSWIIPCALLIIVSAAAGTFANSNLTGIALSLRAYLLIPACALLVVPLIRGFSDIERCAIVIALVSIPVALLGAYQYTLPPTHILNRYDTGLEEWQAAGHLGHTRATGTFAYIAGMSTMTGISAWSGMLLVFPMPGRRDWIRLVGAAAIAAGLVCAAVSMSRGALLTWGVVVGGGTMLYLNANQILVLGLAMASAVVALATFRPSEHLDMLIKEDSLATGLAYRIQYSNDSFASRLEYMLSDLSAGLTNYPIGEGLGLGQPGGTYAARGTRKSVGIESEWGRIAYEVGIAGLVGVLLIRLVPGLICWRALRQTTNMHRRLVLASTLPLFGIMCITNVAFNHTGNSAAWVAMAMALAAVPGEKEVRRSKP